MAKVKTRNEIRFLLNSEAVALADVAPDWIHPAAKQTARALAERIPSTLVKTAIVIA